MRELLRSTTNFLYTLYLSTSMIQIDRLSRSLRNVTLWRVIYLEKEVTKDGEEEHFWVHRFC
jgi:hypothetical protein